MLTNNSQTQIYQDLEYCNGCGKPTLHNAFCAPFCEECRAKQTIYCSICGAKTSLSYRPDLNAYCDVCSGDGKEGYQDIKTLVVNLLGGPGSGKSSVRAGVFHDLKFSGVDCEEAAEYAKDLTWAKNQFTLQNQIHVFGEQHNRIFRLLNQVEVIITDSPLLLTPIYDKRSSDTLRRLALEEYHSMWNYTVLLIREKQYNPNGRNQNEKSAKEIDIKIADFLLDNKIPFETVPGNSSGKDKIVTKVMMLLNRKVE